MLTAILAFFQAIPAITGGINNFVSKYYDAKVQITMARYKCDESVARQLISGIVAEGQTRVEFLKVVASSPFLMWVVGLFAGPWIIYEWKVVVWDNILHFTIYGKHGFTPPIEGTVGTWAGIILTGIFGGATVMAGAKMYFDSRSK